MNLNTKSGTVGYNNEILVSDPVHLVWGKMIKLMFLNWQKEEETDQKVIRQQYNQLSLIKHKHTKVKKLL